MRKLILIAALASVLTGCAAWHRFADWPTDPNAPSWAVPFWRLTSINTQAVINKDAWFWNADRVTGELGKALAAVWTNPERTEFALTYRTDHPDYSYVSVVFREDAGRTYWGYLDFEIHKTDPALRAAVAQGEMVMLRRRIDEMPVTRKRIEQKEGI